MDVTRRQAELTRQENPHANMSRNGSFPSHVTRIPYDTTASPSRGRS